MIYRFVLNKNQIIINFYKIKNTKYTKYKY